MYGFSGMYGRSYGVSITGARNLPGQIPASPQDAFMQRMALYQRAGEVRQEQPEEEEPPPPLPEEAPATSPWVYVAGALVTAGVVGGAIYFLRSRRKSAAK